MEIFDCILEITQGDMVKNQRIQAPRPIIEHQFLSLVDWASNVSAPVCVRLIRYIPVYCRYNDSWAIRENSIVFENPAFSMHEPK